MSLLINDIAEYLEDEGIGTVGEDIFKSMLPANIDDVVAVYETGGLEPDPYLPTKSPTFQVFIRSSNYTTGMAQAMAVRTALHRKANITLVAGGNYYYYILLMSEPAHLGKDENGRDEFSMNFRCKIR